MIPKESQAPTPIRPTSLSRRGSLLLLSAAGLLGLASLTRLAPPRLTQRLRRQGLRLRRLSSPPGFLWIGHC